MSGVSAAAPRCLQPSMTAARSDRSRWSDRPCASTASSAPAIQLVDLFILQAYRSAQLVRKLYQEVEQICAARGIRYLLALPNDKSVLLNARFLKLAPLLSMPIRAGLSLLADGEADRHSGLLKSMTRQEAIESVVRLRVSGNRNGLRWDAELPARPARRSHPRLRRSRHRQTAADLRRPKDRRHPLCRAVRFLRQPLAR